MSADVHVSHCCKWHGCSYGDEPCPVVSGTYKQEYSCETCHWQWDKFNIWQEKMKNPLFLEWVEFYKEQI